MSHESSSSATKDVLKIIRITCRILIFTDRFLFLSSLFVRKFWVLPLMYILRPKSSRVKTQELIRLETSVRQDDNEQTRVWSHSFLATVEDFLEHKTGKQVYFTSFSCYYSIKEKKHTLLKRELLPPISLVCSCKISSSGLTGTPESQTSSCPQLLLV